jgi:hypothetical protein
VLTGVVLAGLSAACVTRGTQFDDVAPDTLMPPPGAPSCPSVVIREGSRHGAACMDPFILGDERVLNCGSYLLTHGWRRDMDSESLVYRELGRPYDCYSAP